jgi:hypothetical protein
VFSFPLSLTAPTWVDKDKVRSVLNDAFKKYGVKEASPGDITKALMELGLIDKERNAHRQRGYEAGYRFRPLNEARATFAEKRKLTVAMLTGADTARSTDEELQDLTDALATLVEKSNLLDGEPENYAAIKKAVRNLQAAVYACKAATTDTASEAGDSASVH